jgi:hypothetical protein
MPPEPVSGFCILPRAATIASTARRTASPSAVGALELAERRGVEVEPLDPDPDLVGPQLLAGVEPLGRLRQHDAVVEDPVQTRSGRWRARSFSSVTGSVAGQDDLRRCALDRPQILHLQWHSDH